MPRMVIRRLKRLEEYRECERLQKEVWGNLGVGSEVLSVTQKYGGMVLGAFVGGRMAGFLYAFLGRYRGQLVHWSHMMAVEARYRDQGLGFRMKRLHRRLALAQGIRTICWTYDPLQSRNAALNLHRLGALAEEYIPDCYGHFPSAIEKGLPSDRLVAQWPLTAARVERRLAGGTPAPSLAFPRANETRPADGDFLENARLRLDLKSPRLLVEIPANTDAMRARALPLARRWRLEIRRVFLNYFRAGYVAEDFLPPGPATSGRCFYVLRRRRTA
jgi:predicted GNAT superfamily acetyltransferase